MAVCRDTYSITVPVCVLLTLILQETPSLHTLQPLRLPDQDCQHLNPQGGSDCRQRGVISLLDPDL